MTGRWPANVILSPGMAKVLDQQSGHLAASSSYTRTTGAAAELYGKGFAEVQAGHKTKGYGDPGGASRFFLNAGYESWELEWIYSVGLRPCGTE